MSVPYYGDFAEDDTIDIPFNTFTSDDPSASSTITNLINTDIHIHKDGGLTQRNNAAGITVSVDFDGITGNHLVKIDTSDDTVAGFWVTGSEYQVRMEGTTIDGGTVNAWIGAFSIERAGGVIALLKLIQAAVITNAAGTDIAADIIAVKAETAAIVNDTDIIDDGTSGLVKIASDVADILTDTSTTLDTLIKDIPTNAEFNARTLPSADYVVTTDTIAGVTAVTNDVGITQAGADKVWSTAERVLTANTNLNDPTAAAIRTEIDSNSTQLAAILSKLLKYVQLLARSDAAIETDNATELTAINADGGSGAGNFSNQTDSVEAIRDVAPHGTAMRGTDGANTTVPDAAGTAPTVAEIQAEMEENGASLLDTIRDDLDNATDGLGALKTLIDNLQATANTIEGYTDKIDDATNGLTAIKAEVEGLGGAAMRGTDNAALAATALSNVVWTDAKAGYLDHSIATVDTVADGIQTDLSNATDGLGALKALIDGLNNISAADVKTAMEAAGSDLDYLVKALINKMVITEATGNTEQFNDADVSLGSIVAAFASDGTFTTRKRMVI